ncbi:MAG: flavin oxidoreductase [Saprospiraceae bacterium]|nr:flavin oxidoreductase [Saprospiraceae bacterium]
MKWTTEEIMKMDKFKRINIINSITGIKPANLIGTRSRSGATNLAIFTSVFHMGSKPPFIGMLFRPDKDVRRHTLENIRETRQYTINHVNDQIIEQSHYTSAKFDAGVSEFEGCGFKEEYIEGFSAPFVQESKIKIGLTLEEEIPISLNDTIIVVGQIEHIIIEGNCLMENGYIDLENSQSVGVSGLNSYYSLNKKKDLPYARVEEMPDFKAR